MNESRYDKLVRDKIPQIIKDQGNIPVIRVLSDGEYIEYLNKKLKEETEEYLESNCIEELCDIMEVTKAIASALNFTDEKIEEVRKCKVQKNGAFLNKIVLEKVIINTPDDHT